MSFMFSGGGSGGGGTTSPGGSSGDIQYNNAGSFGGITVVPAANGGAADLRTAQKGYFWGAVGFNDAAITGTATPIAPTGANTVLVFQFALDAIVTVRKVTFLNGSTVTASATASFGIYDLSGNLLLDSGAFSTAVATQNLTNTLGSPVTLNPGIYWFAQACTNGTNDARGSAAGAIFTGSVLPIARNLNTVRQGTAANAYSGGVLPATLGVVTGVTTRAPVAILFEA